MGDITNIISTLGFPIFSFILCGAALKYVYDNSIREIAKLTEAVNQNTITLTKLVENFHLIKEDE